MVCAKGAEEFLGDAITQLKMVANDRSQDVWLTLVQVVDYWLKNMEFYAMRKFEKDLTLLLLNGVAEDLLPDISELA